MPDKLSPEAEADIEALVREPEPHELKLSVLDNKRKLLTKAYLRGMKRGKAGK
jgi:hypothetical protein